MTANQLVADLTALQARDKATIHDGLTQGFLFYVRSLYQEGEMPESQARKLVADLTYINYRRQREYAPQISPDRWEKVFGPDAELLEARYQAEILREHK